MLLVEVALESLPNGGEKNIRKTKCGDPMTCAPSKWERSIGKSKAARNASTAAVFLAQVVRQDRLQETLHVFNPLLSCRD